MVGALAAAVIVVAGGTIGGLTLTDHQHSKQAARATSALATYTVVYTGPTGVTVVALSGHGHWAASTAVAGPPIETSAGVAFAGGGMAYLLVPPFNTRPRPLVAADGLFPMVWPGMIGTLRQAGSGSTEAQYVDIENGTAHNSGGWNLPPGYRPVGQFLAEGSSSELRSWQPGTNGHTQLGPVIGHAAAVLGSDGSRVAWIGTGACPSGECPLHISNTASQGPTTDHTIAPPAGHHGFLAAGSLTSDGTKLAAFVAAPGSRGDQAQLAIVDTSSLDVTLVPDSTIDLAGGTACAHWTPDNLYLLFSGPKGKMKFYEPGAARAITLDVNGSDSFAVE
jgi:hypothetical protein